MPYEKSNKEIQESKVKGFKMKGSPMKRNFGVGADSPMKETTSSTLKGMDFNPYAHNELNASNIPSFRDMVSLEQQQAARKAWKAKRADKKLDRQMQKDLKEDSTPERIGKRRDEMYNITQDQQRKTLESQRQMEEEGPKIDLSEHIINKPLTLPGTKTSYEGATKNEMTDIRREFKDDGSWDPKNNPEHAQIQMKINELYA